MDWNRIEGNWKKFSGKVKQEWSDLTDSELARVDGKREELVGVLQQRYGYAKDKAKQEVDRWARSLEADGSVAERVGRVRDDLSEVGTNLGEAVRKSTHDQPVTSLLVAAFVGFALGAIWRS